ncbi:uncharacterized protein QC761_118720 [Podospora bellae-mahoneyi]|uniref:Uncharacterized protein n=1 Tax=Podospora bellae-mahoneyi TaxID=2093777 RepID=A0ABR0G122_9PEZI|nr:hypothetical protein QC761_118720 [Podospora bellae-mahoneyi]
MMQNKRMCFPFAFAFASVHYIRSSHYRHISIQPIYGLHQHLPPTMDTFQFLLWLPASPLSLALLVLVAILVSILVTFYTTKQHYQNSTWITTTTATTTTTRQQTPKDHQPQPPAAIPETRQQLVQESLLPAEQPRAAVQEQPTATQPIPIPIPTSPVGWRNSFGPAVMHPSKRDSLVSSVGARKGSYCARCSSWPVSDWDGSGSGSEGEVVGGSFGREVTFGFMGAHL